MNFAPVFLVLASITLTSAPSDLNEPTDYKTAYNRAMQGDKPLVILVTADWCPPCRMMKQTTIPQLLAENKFREFHFATVDLDRDAKDARNLIGMGTVPQLIVYEKKNGSWKTRRLGGYHSPSTVEMFLDKSNPVRTANSKILTVDQ